MRGDLWTFSRAGEVCGIQVRGNFKANNSEAVRDAALDGLGIALLPTFAIWQEIAVAPAGAAIAGLDAARHVSATA